MNKNKIVKKTKDSIIYEGGQVISRKNIVAGAHLYNKGLISERNVVVGAILCDGVLKNQRSGAR